jgi:ADP-heptose:LPS heptosyltransferase
VEEAEIHYLTKAVYAPLLELNPYIDHIHSYEGDLNTRLDSLKKEEIDYIIDLHHNLRSARVKFRLKRLDFSVHKLNWKKWLFVTFKINRLPGRHMVDRNLDTISPFIEKRDDKGLDYFIPEQQEVDIRALPPAFRNGYIGLSIGAQHETKKLPAESLVKLCLKLDLPVVILGGPGDLQVGETILASLPGKDILNGCGPVSFAGEAGKSAHYT